MVSRLRLRRCTVDLGLLRVLEDDRTESLTAMEARLLAYLTQSGGRTVSHDELLKEVWEYSSRSSTQTVRMTVGRLRAKIEADPANPDHLTTVTGEGYRWVRTAEGLEALPATRTAFVGRMRSMDALHDALLEPGCVTLLGPGGAGKTRLAAEYVRSGRFDGQALFCDLTAVYDADGLVQAVAGALRAPLPDAGDAVESVGRMLKAYAPAVVVLDNFEQLVPHTDVVVAWLRAASELRLLVTSRQRLPLAKAEVLEVGPLEAEHAATLFAEAAGVQVDEGTVTRIVERLNRLPLAIELAAPWAATMTGPELEARIDDRFRLLTTRDDDVPDRHRSLRAALEGSWGMLSASEQALLVQCGVFRGPFSLTDVEQVVPPEQVDTCAETLRSLQDKSLVSRDAAGFRLLESTARFVAPRIDAATRSRHAALVAARCEALDAELAGPAPAVAQATFAAWLPNVTAVIEETSDADVARRIALATPRYFAVRGPARQHLRLLDAVLALDPPDRLRLRRERADALRRTGRTPEARDLLRILIDEASDPADEARIAMSLGQALTYLREGGRQELERALEAARQTSDEPLTAAALSALASAQRLDGELQAAVGSLERAIAIQERHGRALELTASLLALGEIRNVQARRDAARHHTGRALAIARRTGNLHGEQHALLRLGEIELAEANPADARTLFEEAIERCRRLGFRRGEAQALWRLGTAEQRLGEPIAAEEALVEAERRFVELGNDYGARLVNDVRAVVAMQIGEPARGVSILEESVIELRARGADMMVWWALMYLGLARWLAGDVDGARKTLLEAAEACDKVDLAVSGAACRGWLAALVAPREPDRAVEWLALAKPVLREAGASYESLLAHLEDHVARHTDWPRPPRPLPMALEDPWITERLLR